MLIFLQRPAHQPARGPSDFRNSWLDMELSNEMLGVGGVTGEGVRPGEGIFEAAHPATVPV